MKLRFNRQKFKIMLLNSLSVLLTGLIPMIIVVLEGLYLPKLQSHMGPNIFDFNNFKYGNLITLALWFGSPIVTFLFWWFTKSSGQRYINSFFVYTISIFIPTLIPLAVTKPAKTTTKNIAFAVFDTKVFFITLYVTLVIGFIVNIYLVRNLLKKSNWWLFIISLPYMFTSFLAISYHRAFLNLTQYSDFSYRNLSKMFTSFKQVDIRYMNSLWYQVIAFVVVSMIFLEGVNIGAFAWKKTKKWRKSKKAIQSKHDKTDRIR